MATLVTGQLVKSFLDWLGRMPSASEVEEIYKPARETRANFANYANTFLFPNYLDELWSFIRFVAPGFPGAKSH